MLVKDFRELRATVERMGLLEPNQLFFFLLLGHILLLDIAAWLILFYFGTSLLPFVFSLLVLTISQVSNEFHGMDLHPTHTHTHTQAVSCPLFPHLARFYFAIKTQPLSGYQEKILHVGSSH